MTDELKQAVERLDELESMLILMGEERYFKPLRTVLDAIATARRDAFEEAARWHDNTRMSYLKDFAHVDPKGELAAEHEGSAASIRALADGPTPAAEMQPGDIEPLAEFWVAVGPCGTIDMDRLSALKADCRLTAKEKAAGWRVCLAALRKQEAGG